MVKKVRLLDGDEAVTETPVAEAPASSDLDTEQLMKYLEAIDWKLWELLKLARKFGDEESQ